MAEVIKGIEKALIERGLLLDKKLTATYITQSPIANHIYDFDCGNGEFTVEMPISEFADNLNLCMSLKRDAHVVMALASGEGGVFIALDKKHTGAKT